MDVTVNGKVMELAEGTGVQELLKALGLSEKRVAVEHNRKILTPDNYPSAVLNDGDVIEILSFVGGG